MTSWSYWGDTGRLTSVRLSRARLSITKYGLLPNDALIAATCKHHGISKIATFDPDFKIVDFLETITRE
ncbi:PIN domain-containing protein [Methanophagales archaeon]|nr:MAG: PIN domain-containing protein [Methanophagales archaeon]